METKTIQKVLAGIRKLWAAISGKNEQLRESIAFYLLGRSGRTSMKQIQSRFDKERGRTCADYAAFVESLGWKVEKSSNHPSKWYVSAVH